MKFIEDAKLVNFNEAKHTYTLGGQDLISVTKFIDLFKEPFDATGAILKRCAIKEGISEIELKERWLAKGKNAGKIGSDIHASIEHYLNTSKIKKNKYAEIVKKFSGYKFRGKIFSEVLLFDEIGIAGTSDIVQIIDNKIVQIHDIKSNEKIPTDYSFGKRMKHPISHLDAGKLICYELQISLYLYLLSSKYGYEIGQNHFIFWINRKKNEIVKIPVRLRMKEVIDMISFYSYNQSLKHV